MTKPTQTPEQLNQVLSWADWLFLTKENTYLALSHDGNSRAINEEALAALHPLLPIAIRGAIEHANIHSESIADESIDASYAKMTARVLREGVTQMQGFNGKTYDFVSFSDIKVPPSRDCLVELTGTTVALDYVEVENQRVPFVINTYRQVIEQSFEQLDLSYPGWSERLKIGQSLDLGINGLLKYSLNNDALPNSEVVPISDVMFDFARVG